MNDTDTGLASAIWAASSWAAGSTWSAGYTARTRPASGSFLGLKSRPL